MEGAATASNVLERLQGVGGSSPLFLPDLTLWYRWHRERGSFPAGWEAPSLAELCRRRGLALWLPVRPWYLEYRGLAVESSEEEGVRETRWRTSAGTLTARWTLGPDGDWWQTEFPVTGAAQLAAGREIVASLAYGLDSGAAEAAARAAGERGVAALELPMRPLSELLHSFLGWSEGLLLLWEEPAGLGELEAILEEKLQALVRQVAGLPGAMVLSPDNLDGAFLSPELFAEHLAPSYRVSAAVLAPRGKRLVVHAGGPLRGLLPLMAGCGVGAVEGVCGPPQSDASLREARRLAGPELVLWGGVPQDALLETTREEAFQEALAAALEDCRQPGMLLGVADRVPPQALPGRLEELAQAVAG